MKRTLLLLLLLALPAAAAPAEPARRLAVVVGSNVAIDGRPSLRYSHRDATSVAEVLTQAGRFEKADVAVLLDPKPAEVLAALDAKLAEAKRAPGPTLLVFYYSGHADSRALFPGGEALPVEALKARLASDQASLRVGIIDACRGGGWTAAKGLKPAESFEVGLPQLSSEGTVLLAASSGLEDAHEAESLQGSFFTHHLVAGLRGAADTTGEGQVTLSEAFAYANRMTIRDTAMASGEPQHPSFDLRLHGRQDIVLTSADASANVLTVEEQRGPLQIVQLSTGDVIVEAPAGQNTYRLALPPGDYLVRRVEGAEVRARQVSVAMDQKVQVSEASLELVGRPLVASKGVEAPPPRYTAAVGGSGIPGTSGFWSAGTLEAEFGWRLTGSLAWRAHLLYAFVTLSGLNQQLQKDFGVVPSSLPSIPAFTVGTNLAWAFWRSEQLPSGFRFEPVVSLGPTLVGLRTAAPDLAGNLAMGPLQFGAGLSVSLEGAMRLPHLPELWLVPVVGTDLLWPLGQPPDSGGFVQVYRFGALIQLRFGPS